MAVKLVIGIFPNGAGIENYKIWIRTFLSWDISGCIQRASDTFRIMNVHLAAQSLDDVGTAHMSNRTYVLMTTINFE